MIKYIIIQNENTLFVEYLKYECLFNKYLGKSLVYHISYDDGAQIICSFAEENV